MRVSQYRIAENFGELRYSLKLANNILANCVAPPHKSVGYGPLLCYCSKLASDILMNARSQYIYGTAQMQLDTRRMENRGSHSISPRFYARVPVEVPVSVYPTITGNSLTDNPVEITKRSLSAFFTRVYIE